MKRHSAAGRQIAGFGLPQAYQYVPESDLQRLLTGAQLGRWRDLKQAAGYNNVNRNRVIVWDDNVLRRVPHFGFPREVIRKQK